ncbi:hypothetical protein BAUCODRAFT_346262 [Baudoinia panamericana UAMH 10762]|uniref:Protein Zds1 C-terminal domain-containing protein n=1 Tax=Baudoinia panamericana (strain UAMH 10762) TaxID=717646 RepID=M2NJT7_BAUPA|nr:uncharacterized protein BAUCODRAFT_346262 [Baudoinia panamericana UAMH 10762]EMC99684.1 hypothetical protein BAUCODRAFT_346262 [Baudoinia panamericana UAMH 10762]
MQQSPTRQADADHLPRARRPYKAHVPHISITDNDHHVTEAIGSYYDEQSPTHNKRVSHSSPSTTTRPYSFMPSTKEVIESRGSKRGGGYFDMKSNGTSPTRNPSERVRSGEQTLSPVETGSLSPISVRRMGSVETKSSAGSHGSAGQVSPPPLTRQASTETAIQQFPLNDIDYESSPAAVAQELSNLQAIRRMSMNVDNGDPDLAGFGTVVPTLAPKPTETDESDASQLFWVPARLHPELAPKEFKTFIEDRVEKIRRKSGDSDSLSVEGLDRSGSGSSSLRRKKSMLSHQIDTKGEYEDGAERLERKRSKRLQIDGQTTVANLADLESLVNDPESLRRRLSLDTVCRSQDSGIEVPPTEDMPILPPGGQTLKRSTRTTYRRGSLKKGERVPFSKRAQQRQTDLSDADETPAQSPVVANIDEREPILGLTRVQTEPTPLPSSSETGADYIPSARHTARRRAALGSSQSSENLAGIEPARQSQERRRSPPPRPSQDEEEYLAGRKSSQQPRQFQSRLATGGRTTAHLPGYTNTNPLPQVIETLPDGTKIPIGPLVQQIPERKASHEFPRAVARAGAHVRPPGRPSTLDDLSGNPSPLPGHGATRTDALTMVPTFEDRKPERKDSTRKSSWKWLIGTDDEEKEKEKKAAREERALDGGLSAAAKVKASKLSKAPAEKARLDVLQNSIDGTIPARGRESIVLNRADVQLDDERKKESKKASDGDLKDKKRKADRGLSPIPSPRILKPDIDYNWTRFSILEERAIYRMAHMKLANPRRALYSQVLLSNFMYSYLAKVQQMHPQMQIPSAQQQQAQQQQQQQHQQKAAQQRKDDQPAEYSQYQRWQEARQEAHTTSGGRPSTEVGGGAGASRTSYETDEHSTAGYDHRDSEEANGIMTGGISSASPQTSGYSVASTHDYLGYHKDEQPFSAGADGRLWDDEKAEGLW